MDRMGSSAEYFEFQFDREGVTADLDEVAKRFERGQRIKVRVLLERNGVVKVTHARAEEPTGMGKVMISAIRVFIGRPVPAAQNDRTRTVRSTIRRSTTKRLC